MEREKGRERNRVTKRKKRKEPGEGRKQPTAKSKEGIEGNEQKRKRKG